jgi:Peptidase family C25/Galactose oxidase, central domain
VQREALQGWDEGMDMKKQALLLILLLSLLATSPLGGPPPTAAQPPGRWPASSYLPYWRRSHSTVYDAANSRLILFGGWNGRRLFNDAWALYLTPGAEEWVQLEPAGVRPAPRAAHSAVYDAASGRMILFGGRSAGGDLDDTWALDLTPGAEAWVHLQPAGSPPSARSSHAAAYDPDRQRLILFGGVSKGQLLADTWALDLAPSAETWQILSPSGGPPPARAGHTVVADTANGRMILFAGAGSGGLLADLWALDLTSGAEAWSLITPGGTLPPARRSHTAVYDGVRQRMLLFGGVGQGAFLDDLWALDLIPGAEAWQQLTPPYSRSQSAGRAWHTAILDAPHDRLVIIGGFGPLQAIQQWALNLDPLGWEPLLPGEPELPSDASLSLQVEDAPEGATVNKLLNSYLDVTARLAAVPEASQGISLTLTVHGNQFGQPSSACLRYSDAGDCTPLFVDNQGNGCYTVQGINLAFAGGAYSGQVRFRFYVANMPAQPSVDLTAQAAFPTITAQRDAVASVRVASHVDALIVTNRTLLYQAYDDAQVRSLLGRLYELAEGEAGGQQPDGAVYYVDTYSAASANWDNWAVDYTSPATANSVASAIDLLIGQWAARAGDPTYLLIVGDDDIVPFYRSLSDGDEASHPQVGNDYYPLNQAVSNDYHFTDNPYADLDGGWEQGDVELAAGRIVGESAADLLTFIDSSQAGPAPDSGHAVVLSVLDEWTDPDSGDLLQSCGDAILPGPDNDLVDALRDDWGLDVLNDVETPVTIETKDWDRDDLLAAMEQGFVAFQSMSHSENNYVCLTGCCGETDNQLTPYRIASLPEQMAAHPFFFLEGCRTGLSLGRHWDETLVWALAHTGASGAIASAGLSYYDPGPDVAGSSEAIANEFWLRAIEDGQPLDTVGLALRDVRQDYDPGFDWSYTDQNLVQSHTLFGLPWLSLPSSNSKQTSEVSEDFGSLGAGAVVPDGTYVVTTTIDVSQWSTSTVDGFDLVQVEGLRLSRYDAGPVVPVADVRLSLPRAAGIVGIDITLRDLVDLGPLDIPTFLARPSYPEGPPSVYTRTEDAIGVYPPQPGRLEVTPRGTWQLARLSLVPLVYDAATDQTTLIQRIDVTVTYTSTTPVAALALRTNQRVYLPGQPVTAWAWLRNVTGAAVTITPTLAIADPQGQVRALQAGSPLALPPGVVTTVPIAITPALDEGSYQVRFAAWHAGQPVAAVTRDIAVLAGQVDLDVQGSQKGSRQFQVTFANAGPDPVPVLVHLGVFDPAGQLVSDLQPQAAVVSGASAAALGFGWDPGTNPRGTYTAVAWAVSGGYVYGPRSQPVQVGHAVYLPLVLRAGP